MHETASKSRLAIQIAKQAVNLYEGTAYKTDADAYLDLRRRSVRHDVSTPAPSKKNKSDRNKWRPKEIGILCEVECTDSYKFNMQ